MAPRRNLMMRNTPERRGLPPTQARTTSRMSVAADGEGLMLVDLSHAGCAAESRRSFLAGDELYLTFTLDTCLSFLVPVRVVYARSTPRPRSTFLHLVGFEFVSARQPDIHRIVEILLEVINEPLSVH